MIMGKMETLRQKRAELVAELEALAAPKDDAGNDVDFTEDHQKAFDAKDAEIKGVDAEIEREARLEKARAAAARPLPSIDLDVVPAEPAAPRVKGGAFANIVQALAAEQGNRRNAAAYAEGQNWADKDGIAKALGSSTATGGGFIVPDQYSSDIIELLRNEAVIMRAGPKFMPLSGTSNVAKLTAGANGGYIGENANIGKEQQTFGQLRMTAKKLASLVPVSNDLIRNSSPSVTSLIRDDMVSGLAVTADAAFIRDLGTGAAPKGIRYWAASGNVTATNGTTAANIESDLSDAMGSLQDNNSPMVRPVWLMAPRSHRHLYKLRDANGNLIYPELRQTDGGSENGRLYGYPVFLTNNIPTNLGGSSNETEIYFVDMAQVVIGEETGIELMVSDTAAYHDGSNVVAAFSQDQTVIRAIMRHDLVVRHDVSVAVKTGVTWGA
jgi:HK97 family phage major capsid protein